MKPSADPATILIVDDDPEITSALARGLAMHGYATICESGIAPALQHFSDPQVSAAIVDVMIGEDSGIALVRSARQAGHDIPVLMLSALAEVEDRAAGLEAGANDYIVKPFSFDELVARLKVQEHRAPSAPSLFDAATRAVRCPSREVHLTEREFRLLSMLHQHNGTPLPRGTLFDALWAGEGTSSENVVDVYIGYLRKKLAPMSDFKFEIKTIRSKGFLLELSENG